METTERPAAAADRTRARSEPPDRVTIFPTCVVDLSAPEVGIATVGVLERHGIAVELAAEATCCGQPAWNSGHAGAAYQVARTTLHALADVDGQIVVPSGSCSTMMRVYWPELFELEGSRSERLVVNDVVSRIAEFSEFLHGLDLPADAPGTPAPDSDAPAADATPTVYHRSCHMSRELGIVDQPEELLAGHAGDVRESAGTGKCCGFGGMFSVKMPEVSTAMADEVLDAIVDTGAERVVACDVSCMMHMQGRSDRRGLDLRFEHLAEVMDAEGGPS